MADPKKKSTFQQDLKDFGDMLLAGTPFQQKVPLADKQAAVTQAAQAYQDNYAGMNPLQRALNGAALDAMDNSVKKEAAGGGFLDHLASGVLGAIGAGPMPTPDVAAQIVADPKASASQVAAAKAVLAQQPKQPQQTISFDFGGGGAQAQTGPIDFGNFSNAIEGVESSHRAGVSGPATKYGTAHGSMQVLDSTGEATAKKYGIPWDASKMTGTDAGSLAYQRQIGGLVLQDALVQAGGDPILAAKIYHGGPDQKLWGPQTEAYAAKVAQALGLGAPQSGIHGYSALSPAAANLIPNPQPVESRLLPLAPALEAPAAQAQLPQMDKSVIQPLLDAYAAQGQVTPNDQALARKATNRQAINEALTYGLVGALGGGLPGLLAGGAFGYLQGGNHGKQAEIAGRQVAADQARKNLINAALQEVAMNKDNYTIGNQNLDRAVLTEQGQIDTRNTNKMNANQREVQQVQQDQGVDQFNTNAQNQANLVRAQTQLALEQGVVQAQNTTGDKQDKYALVGLTAGNTPVVNSLLQSIGVSPQKKPGQPEASGVELARQAAQFISVNNVPAVLNTFAQEISDSGLAPELLNDAELKTYNDYVKAKNKGAAAALIAKVLSDNRKGALEWAQTFAQRGYPVAQLIAKNGHPTNKPAADE